jgi:hypothetical protein
MTSSISALSATVRVKQFYYRLVHDPRISMGRSRCVAPVDQSRRSAASTNVSFLGSPRGTGF